MLAFGPSRFVYFWLSIAWIWLPAKTHLIASDNNLSSEARSSRGLVVLYTFQETGNIVHDEAGFGTPLNLEIKQLKRVRRNAGSLAIRGEVEISSNSGTRKLSQAINRSGEITVEVWIEPDNVTQAGPARIVSLSSDSSHRNFTLGQDKDRFDFRLRTQKTNENGLPSLSSPKKLATTQLTHLVYTHRRDGRRHLYINGKRQSESSIAGSFSNWRNDFQLRLADEAGGGRLWRGTYHLVAIFDRCLTETEVEQHFRLGAEAKSPAREAPKQLDHFVTKIAPIFAEHCLECHDASTRRGGLDLSHKTSAFVGGDSGPALVAGQSDKSLLVQSILHDDMPLDRPPLEPADKKLLQDWIQSGATWTMDFVDPALFLHDGGADQLWVQRLTRPEYIASVQATVGVDIRDEALELLPPDLRADGFSNTAYNLQVDLKHIEAYSKLARIATQKMDVATFARRFSTKRKFTDKDIGDVIEKMGRWVLRGPLSEEEIILYRGISTTAASSGRSFDEAVRLILEGMLQSPRFLYRIETQQGDGFARPVDRFELASRISFILWGSSPDEELYKAADRGDLQDPSKLQQQVLRMLDAPQATDRAKQFIREWLNLSSLENLRPNPERFPQWNAALARDMQEETLQFFVHVAIRENRPMHELLTAETTFVSPALAKHYRLQGITPASEGGETRQVDLASDPHRGGLLTQGSVLTMGGDDASTVTRGLFLLHDLLRGVVKDPPPCVDTTPVPTEPGLTQRMIANRRIGNEACGGCHSKFEPLAFGLGKFDGLGTYLEQDEHGNSLEDHGNILFPGTAEPKPFANSAELMQMLADNPRVRESLTWKVVQFAMARPLSARDAATIQKIHTTAQQNGGTYRSLMMALVTSDLVQKTPTQASWQTETQP